jgi:hypothetical protein
MGGEFLTVAGIVAFGAVVFEVFRRRLVRDESPVKERLRRGTGHALLGLQEFIEPSVEYVFQAQNVEQKEEEDDDGLGEDVEAIRSDLAEALGRTPVDTEEVRRHLTAAARAGLDWKALFDHAVNDELRERPFRAPSIPPPGRVTPRE